MRHFHAVCGGADALAGVWLNVGSNATTNARQMRAAPHRKYVPSTAPYAGCQHCHCHASAHLMQCVCLVVRQAAEEALAGSDDGAVGGAAPEPDDSDDDRFERHLVRRTLRGSHAPVITLIVEYAVGTSRSGRATGAVGPAGGRACEAASRRGAAKPQAHAGTVGEGEAGSNWCAAPRQQQWWSCRG